VVVFVKSQLRRLERSANAGIDRVWRRWTPLSRWLRDGFPDLVPAAGTREDMAALLAAYVRPAAHALGRWRKNEREPLSPVLLGLAERVDDGRIRHVSRQYRSYVDIAVQVVLVRAVVTRVAGAASTRVVRHLIAERPDSRVARLVEAELLLDVGEIDAAIEVVQHALRMQAVCQTGQDLLFRAYAAKRAQGGTSPELEALDYDLTDKFCKMPFTHLATGVRGEAFACSCPAWVPYSAGNIIDADSAEALWNSDTAQEIRRSILDGDFRYCSRTLCAYIAGRKLPRRSEITTPRLREYIERHLTRIEDPPMMFELNHDPTCNLACPSCRTEITTAPREDLSRYARAKDQVILPMLKRVNGHTYITGGGEAFSSAHFRSILRSLNREEYPGLGVYLIMNGLLITPTRWSQYPDLPEMLSTVSVSVDAARADTYERLRRPAKWSALMASLEFLAELRRDERIPRLELNFVVQRANFREMPDFVRLADRIGADNVWFQRIANYGAYDAETFADVNVTAPDHPDHGELLSILRHPMFARPTINLNMLVPLLPERVASDEPLVGLYW
jgi:MoaA/NifB/PqqE/SkfB family radical SAM enzyme